jgi:hypothetical protein
MRSEGSTIPSLPKAKSGRRSLADDGTSVAEVTVCSKQPTHFQVFSEIYDWMFNEGYLWERKASCAGCTDCSEENGASDPITNTKRSVQDGFIREAETETPSNDQIAASS